MNGMSVSSSSPTHPPPKRTKQNKKNILLYCNVQSLSRLVKSISRRGKTDMITIQKWITADTFELSRWDFQILPAFSALHTWLFAAPTQLFQYCGQCPRVSQSCMLSCVCMSHSREVPIWSISLPWALCPSVCQVWKWDYGSYCWTLLFFFPTTTT